MGSPPGVGAQSECTCSSSGFNSVSSLPTKGLLLGLHSYSEPTQSHHLFAVFSLQKQTLTHLLPLDWVTLMCPNLSLSQPYNGIKSQGEGSCYFLSFSKDLFCCKVSKIDLIPGGDSSLAALAMPAFPLQHPPSQAQALFIP